MVKNKGVKPIVVLGIGLTLLFLFAALLFAIVHNHTVAVLTPEGTIARDEFHLMKFATLLSFVVIIPVFALLGFVIFRYRDKNKKSNYAPNYTNLFLEIVWWCIPAVIIAILSVVTWNSTHKLDPSKSLNSTKTPLRVQVVALNWKWLFIYPDYGLASVNELTIPVDQPVDFSITSSGAMNSFWIPQLGGQIYAMSGMNTTLHLMADKVGVYRGVSANISGAGFAGMHFDLHAVSQNDFRNWESITSGQPKTLTVSSFDELSKPSQNITPFTYGSVEDGLFEIIVNRYMPFQSDESGMMSSMKQENGLSE